MTKKILSVITISQKEERSVTELARKYLAKRIFRKLTTS